MIDYGITPEQYHAGLDKLWEALDNKGDGVNDIFTIGAEKIKELQNKIELLTNNRLIFHKFNNALTVKELKKIISTWPEKNEYSGDACEVWIQTGMNLSSPVTSITPLNKRISIDGCNNVSADLLMS